MQKAASHPVFRWRLVVKGAWPSYARKNVWEKVGTLRPESTDGSGGGGLAVPMDWLCAEYLADELLRGGGLVETGSLEYVAGRRTLALTVYLSDGAAPEERVGEWLDRTSHGHPWPQWVRGRLAARREREGDGEPGLALALETWRLLEETELLAADLGALPAPSAGRPVAVDESARTWLPSWQLGLPLGHLSLHLY
ncbi:hypothetical protein BG846_00925 [Streptomyces fradiae ATCC 10745 = DSM 40063]|uniref:Uncharacterized protein n=1 Tax=Streptomyces fradiae ATCC 10745 = DSM 40063 TaxID=1319510 RepID=A0A1Y2P1E7_STRFR|nr:hypothetical protein BG846_00925 [Streptomyces fradiae ATCC 10745 = DSM 40063]